MGDGLARVLSKADFDAESFVKKQLNCSVLSNVEELEGLRRQVGCLKGETSVAMKKNVYKHYAQFIDTAKEISILEGEMYQMSHLLTEQKSIISSIAELSFPQHNDQQKESAQKDEMSDLSSRVSLSFLLEKVEGCPCLNNKHPGISNSSSSSSRLVYDGDVVEVDGDTRLPISRVHLFLLSDCLLVASCLPEMKGTFQYRFDASYELSSLSVVNVRETSDLTCAFKVLVFPTSRLFSAPSPKLKQKWIEVLDEWKKSTVPPLQSPMMNTNPFEQPKEGEGGVGVVEEWVVDAPEDLDVLVAQRDFEGAVDLVIKVENYLSSNANLPDITDLRRRLDHRVASLIEWLTQELSVSADRSIRGGLRSMRRMTVQLLRLGKVSLACDLFLSNRSRVCHHVLKQLTNESQALPYVGNLCDCFFSNMAAISEEFKLVFDGHPRCYSAFIQWCVTEVEYLCSLFRKQVFESNLSFGTIVACVVEAKKGCQKLSSSGVEMLFVLEDLLHQPLLTCIQEVGDTHMEAIKHRAVDDRWKATKLQTNESLCRFAAEMDQAGFPNVPEYHMDATQTYLTSTTVEFSKNYNHLCHQLISLHSPSLHQCISEGLKDILFSYATHIFKAATDPHLMKESSTLIKMNARFVGKEVVGQVKSEFERKTRLQLSDVTPIQEKLLGI